MMNEILSQKARTTFLRVFMLASVMALPFSSSLAQQAEVKLIAHRGGAHEYEENTMHALETAYKNGIRGYEIDIRRTKDGQLVLFHDANLKRMVGREGPVEELTLEEVKKLKTKQGNPIATLDEMLTFFSDKPWVYIEFEMKTDNPKYDEETLARYCDQLYTKVYDAKSPTSDYVLSSFDTRALRYLEATYPDAELMLIKSASLTQPLLDEAKALGVSRIACNIEGTTRAMVGHAKKQGFKINLWPGRSVSDFLLGVSLGNDYLCTDVPVAITEWVKANAPWITLK